jgi:hypothetical protein
MRECVREMWTAIEKPNKIAGSGLQTAVSGRFKFQAKAGDSKLHNFKDKHIVFLRDVSREAENAANNRPGKIFLLIEVYECKNFGH